MTAQQSDTKLSSSSFGSSYLDPYHPAPSPTKHRRRHNVPLNSTTASSFSIMPPYSKYCCQCGGMLVISDKCSACAHTECTKCL
ncbi:hypothetical protein PG994_002549 [Apiospora phragmitis]|uniref:Uncharacterized protein n=1 Tax=Apiospora phragmitis TaxID=2905665 RepID=A0ABR1W6P6_9PEZI